MKKLGTQTIETKRLILRRFQSKDAEQVYANFGTDGECNKYLGWSLHKSVNETSDILKKWIMDYDNGSYNWAVELKKTSEIIGNIQVVNKHEKHQNCEVGYCYGSKWWHNGYATEALRAVIKYLINECEFILVEASHISGNPTSGKVMQKAGMTRDAILRDRRINKHTGELNDLVIYSIKKDELVS